MTASEGSAVLELVGVHKRYGRVSALAGLDLRLERGQVYACLGRNGAGKSTTLRIVMGVTRPDQGEVLLFGSAARPSDVRPRQRIGYVAQEQHFYEWMTPEQLGAFVAAFYPRWQPDVFSAVLRKLEIPPRKIRTFSGGTKVKLALGLALAHRPELLVLDEPTAGLDPVVRREFLELVRELTATGEHSTLFSTHLVDEVERVATRVGIIEAGRMRYEGSLSELTARASRVVIPAAASAQLLSASSPSTPLEAAQRALVDLPLKLLAASATRGELELTLWADQADALNVLEQRYQARRETPSLEDVFVALVRSHAPLTANAPVTPPLAVSAAPSPSDPQ